MADKHEQAHRESMRTWDIIAKDWDEGVGSEGNKYWNLLQRPCLDRFIDVKPGCKALDLATGNGIVARYLASRGAEVVAADGAPEMVQVAKERTATDAHADRITFRKLDVTDEGDFVSLLGADKGPQYEGFDVVTLNMAIMDISNIETLAKFLQKLLKKDGVFVAQLLHPVFFTSGATRIVQVSDEHVDGELQVTRAKMIKKYMSVPPWKGIALAGQSEMQWYFHRPLHELFGTFFKRGFAMDLMDELAFDESAHNPKRLESTSNFSQFPVILAFRLRRLS